MKASKAKTISKQMLKQERLLNPETFQDDVPRNDQQGQEKAREMFLRQAGTKQGIHVQF